MAVKILHCGDLHIGANESFLGEKAASRRVESLLTFERIIEIAKENNVEAVLITGDLFDFNKIEKSFSSRVLEIICSIPQIKVFYSCGNHDPFNHENPFFDTKLPENFYIFPNEFALFELSDSVNIYGKSFGEILEKGEEKLNIPVDSEKVNIMCLHGEYGFNSGRNPISNNFVLTSGMDYIALGHVHARTTPEKVGSTHIAYCGCPEGLGFDELGEKGVYILDIDKNSCNCEFIKVGKRIHISEKVDISSLSDSMAIYSKILTVLKEKYGDNFGENLYKIILSGEIEENISLNTTEVAERLKTQTYFTKVYDNTEIKIDTQALKNEISLKGIFTRKMLERINNEPEKADEYKKALKIGLKAFEGEVNFDENN